MQVFYTFDLSVTEVLHLHPEVVQRVTGGPRLHRSPDRRCEMILVGKAHPAASPCETRGLCELQAAGNDPGSLGAGCCVAA